MVFLLGAGPIVLLVNINNSVGGSHSLYNRGRGCGTPELLRTVLSGCVLAYCCGLWSFC